MKQLFPLLLSLVACTSEDQLGEHAAELAAEPRLIQPGTDQYLLAVTDDNFAVYQEAQAVYATKLVPGAQRSVIGTVPGTNLAQVLQVGKVVFVWTDPQRNLPGFGVSPLVLWTAHDGAQLISSQSSVGLVAAAASEDSRQIVFTTNVTDDGARGDLVHARTKDALNPSTLVANIPLAFPSGQCRPLANFGRDRGREVPVAAYCAGTDTTATLSKWVDGVKTDLIANIATPLQFLLESDENEKTFLVNLANDSVATVTMRGEVTIVDAAARSRVGFIGDGAVGYAVQGAPGALRLARDGVAPEAIGPVTAIFRSLYNRAGYSRRPAVSADGLVLFRGAPEPGTGRLDANLLDVRTGETTSLARPTSVAGVYSEVFTTAGEHALFYTDPTPSFVATLVAGSREGTRVVAEGVWDALAATGSDISYSTDPVVDLSTTQSFYLGTGSLFVTDVACESEPRLVAEDATLFYLPSHDRKRLVYTTRTGGLYLASARP